jgi:hypothetical protein
MPQTNLMFVRWTIIFLQRQFYRQKQRLTFHLFAQLETFSCPEIWGSWLHRVKHPLLFADTFYCDRTSTEINRRKHNADNV